MKKMGTQEMIRNAFFTAFGILFFAIFSTAEGNNMPFMTGDINQVAGKSFDYIVIGGGTSGCPLAATLSEKYSVLVVERGGSPYGNLGVEQRNNYGYLVFEIDEFASVVQYFVSEDGKGNIRGRVLGGSSAINGGFYSRAGKDYIEEMDWDQELVKDAYEWVESKVVSKVDPLTPFQSAVTNGFIEAGVLPFNGFSLEHIEGTKVGGSIFDGKGSRHTAADLLKAGNPTKITVLLNATVHSILFHPLNNEGDDKEKPRARGIKFIRSHGDTSEIYEAHLTLSSPKSTGSKGDVILSAGALSSPQILMLSGIGPKEHLRDFNISTLVDARGVGSRMQDNPGIDFVLNFSQSRSEQPTDPPQSVALTDHFRTVAQPVIFPDSLNSTTLHITSKLTMPTSRGYLRLNSTDPRRNPLVKFNYLATENDLQGCVRNARLLERVAATESIFKYLGTRQTGFVRNGSSTYQELRDLCKRIVSTYYHYHGGCEVGVAVDEDYKVYGVEGVRVVDGSTFRDSPGTNPMATLLMLGRYQGIQILRERERED